ncbi:MAG: hypothetical protein AAGA47_00935 [Pseudomonadota bacterium]
MFQTTVPDKDALIGPRGLRIMAFWLGVSLWFPAFGLSLGPITLQPTDFVILLSYPIVLVFLPRLTGLAWLVMLLFVGSTLASFVAMGGSAVIFFYYLVFPLPFMVMIFIVCRQEDTAILFFKGFFVGAATSVLFAFLQLAVGAERLDFRTNRNFTLPPQFDRAFALFPEISTFATHLIYLISVSLVYLRSGVRKVFSPAGYVFLILVLGTVALMLTRSSSVLLVAPLAFAVAILVTQKFTTAGIIKLLVAVTLGGLLLLIFFNAYYSDRFENNAAFRSMQLRGITMLVGVSVLGTGEVFGVGVGNNFQVTWRALDLGQQLGFSFITIPSGVNSFIIARIFEEGYGALVQFSASFAILVWAFCQRDKGIVIKALLVLSVASLLVSLFVTGYRGIYMNWFWLIVPAAVLARSAPVRRPAFEEASLAPNTR